MHENQCPKYVQSQQQNHKNDVLLLTLETWVLRTQ